MGKVVCALVRQYRRPEESHVPLVRSPSGEHRENLQETLLTVLHTFHSRTHGLRVIRDFAGWMSVEITDRAAAGRLLHTVRFEKARTTFKYRDFKRLSMLQLELTHQTAPAVQPASAHTPHSTSRVFRVSRMQV